MFVALLMVGCGEDSKKPAEDSPESNQSSAEIPPDKSPEVGGIDLDDNETRNRIIAEAIDYSKYQLRVLVSEELHYAPNEQTPFSGWGKDMWPNGQIRLLFQYKDGKKMSVEVWKPNGEKCPVTNFKDGNGVWVWYREDGTEISRETYKDGEKVEYYPKNLDKILAEAIEVNSLQLRGKKGEKLWYAPNENVPYTGWVKDMKYNGEVKSIAQCKDGKKDGLETTWHVNGLKEEINWKDGKKDGLETKWHRNEQKKSEVNYKDGKADGLVTEWNENGRKMAKATFTDGKADGPETWWYSNGQKQGEGNWKDGNLVTAFAWNPNGEKCPVTNVVNGNGVKVWYNNDGTEIYRLTYKDGETVRD